MSSCPTQPLTPTTPTTARVPNGLRHRTGRARHPRQPRLRGDAGAVVRCLEQLEPQLAELQRTRIVHAVRACVCVCAVHAVRVCVCVCVQRMPVRMQCACRANPAGHAARCMHITDKRRCVACLRMGVARVSRRGRAARLPEPLRRVASSLRRRTVLPRLGPRLRQLVRQHLERADEDSLVTARARAMSLPSGGACSAWAAEMQ